MEQPESTFRLFHVASVFAMDSIADRFGPSDGLIRRR
jgi:hypothetical protein